MTGSSRRSTRPAESPCAARPSSPSPAGKPGRNKPSEALRSGPAREEVLPPERARRVAQVDDPDGPLPGILAKIPIGRYGHADEVAKLAAFLAGDDAAFITGAEIAIDGGDGAVAA
jgi:NAD(P)-dependent dehydrogenase (short-subunit alcohol dehydrogenase family)